MDITFDPNKDNINRTKHGVSLALANEFDWSEVWAQLDNRFDYGEIRKIGYGVINSRLYCVVFVRRGHTMRIISLRKASSREVKNMSNKNEIVIPTPEEDKAINHGIAMDPDTYELSDEEFRRLRRVRGQRTGSGKKVQITIRFDVDVIRAFKTVGEGWQTRMNNALKEWLQEHQLA